MKPSIYGLTRQELIEWAEEHGEKKFRATQIWEWLYRKRVLCFSLGMSLWIELSQIVLDLLFDFNRVFEIDDLWTNTLGGYLAYLCFKWLQASISKDKLS